MLTGKRTPGPDTSAEWRSEASLHGTILLVEDELCRIGTQVLQSMGFTVITASDGREALQIYQERRSSIDLVLMDLTMPELDSMEIYHDMCKKALSLPILFCSGYGGKAITSSIQDHTHDGFAPKPHRPDPVRNMLTYLWTMRNNDDGETVPSPGIKGACSGR